MSVHIPISYVNPILIFTITIIAFFNTGCVSKKAIGDINYLANDPNRRIQIENAAYKKQLSPLSIFAISLGAGSGAYLGYNSNLIGYYQENERKTNKIANAAIGTLTGFGISYLTNLAIKGKNPSIQLQNQLDAYKWLRKNHNNGYKIIDFSSKFDDFRIIYQDFESRFVFRDQKDFLDFSKAFGNYSAFFNQNVSRSLKNLDRSVLVWLYTNERKKNLKSNTITELENEILKKSQTISELGETANLIPKFKTIARESAWLKANQVRELAIFSRWFPEWYDKAEEKALNLVISYRAASDFKNNFSNDKALIKKAQTVLNENELYELADLYEVKGESLILGQKKKINYYIPPNSFAVITLKRAPINETHTSFDGINNSEITTLYIKEIGLYYAIKITPTYSSGKFISIDIDNNSIEPLMYCVHYVKNDMQERVESATIQAFVGEIINELLGDYKIIYDFILAWAERKDPIKRLFIEQNIEYFTNISELGITGDIAKGFLVGYIEDILKNIP